MWCMSLRSVLLFDAPALIRRQYSRVPSKFFNATFTSKVLRLSILNVSPPYLAAQLTCEPGPSLRRMADNIDAQQTPHKQMASKSN